MADEQVAEVHVRTRSYDTVFVNLGPEFGKFFKP